MNCKKECIAMLLAGGQGSRLYELTRDIAKPAVSFGGKYKIIDFPLSNCVNSGIDTVGVLTQYQPMLLNEYIGSGESFDLDRKTGGVSILPPYQGAGRADWYRGTANAIYQNLNFIKRYSPDYVLILSADHIYKMDYSKMLDFHKRNDAACTVATIKVPMEDASRFGICIADEDGRIRGFEEKPKKPKSDKASMGIYIFNTDTLFEYLSVDEDDEDSQNDFGKNVLPNLLHSGERLFAYDFSGYWRDVGTLYSLWEANMDLVLPDPPLDLSGKYMRIYTKNDARCPQFIGEGSSVKNSLVAEGCRIFGSVEGSVISAGAVIEEGASVTDSVVMEDAYIMSGVVLDRVIVDRGARIESGVYSSKDPFDICVIGNETINKGERQNG